MAGWLPGVVLLARRGMVKVTRGRSSAVWLGLARWKVVTWRLSLRAFSSVSSACRLLVE